MEELTWLLLLVLSAGVALCFKYYGALRMLLEDWRAFQGFQQEYQVFLAWRTGQLPIAIPHSGPGQAPRPFLAGGQGASAPELPRAGFKDSALALPEAAQAVPGAGRAMLNPPSLLETIRY